MASYASEISADVCVLGGGIAGMLLAERLLDRGRRVLIVERGTAMTTVERLKQGSHADPLPFNRSPIRLPQEDPPPRGPRTRYDRTYPFWPVYNLGGCSNNYFGNLPRFHPSHFDQEAFGGANRRWPIRYAEVEPYYLEAERRLKVAGNSERTPFPGRFDYPLPPHRLSPADRACEAVFGPGSVIQIPTVRPSKDVDDRPACCGTNRCDLCPIDSKGTALNTIYPSIERRIELRSGWLATEVHCQRGRVEGVTCQDADGRRHRIRARTFVVACNGVDSCLLLQRSASVPQLPALGGYFLDHPVFEIGVYDSGLDTKPGYGDSAQTGMLLTYFERVSPDLPVSMLGEIRPVAFSLNAGEFNRDTLVRDIIAAALRSEGGGGFRDRFRRIWSGSLDLFFPVEIQPTTDCTVSIDRIEPSGQAIPKIRTRYPQYFGACIDRVVGHIRRRLPRAVVRHVSSFPSSYHWLGATRMASDERVGCVDKDLRYHELENLYVLSTSVFCSSSSANPTTTLAALALRLGDRLAPPASREPTGGGRPRARPASSPRA